MEILNRILGEIKITFLHFKERSKNKYYGDRFEEWVVKSSNISKDGSNNSNFWKLLEWRGDKYIEGYRPLSSSSPDLLMECISDKSVFYTSQERIAVECKWRSKKNFFLDEKCIIKYEDYISSDEHKYPPKHLFYVIGFGWSCDNPEVVYVIPAKKLYNYSKEKHKVKLHFRKEDVDRLELFDDYKHKNTSKYLIYKPATEQSNI